MEESLHELENLLNSNLDAGSVKHVLTSMCGMFLDEQFCNDTITKHPGIICKLFNYSNSGDDRVQPALECLINVTSHVGSLSKLEAALSPSQAKSVSCSVSAVINAFVQATDVSQSLKSAQLLTNLTREDSLIFDLSALFTPEAIDKLMKVALSATDDLSESELLKINAAMNALNLSRDTRCQKCIAAHLNCNEDILESCKKSPPEQWLLSVIGMLKNLLKNPIYHQDLVEKSHLMTVLLHPLVVLNNYDEKVSSGFPDSLKPFLGQQGHVSIEVRSCILEALYLLSGTKWGRNAMRNSNVYDILKNLSESDLSDPESDNCLDCIGLLIRTEDEIACDDLLSLNIPSDIQNKFTAVDK